MSFFVRSMAECVGRRTVGLCFIPLVTACGVSPNTVERMTESNRLDMMQGMTVQQLCRGYNNSAIGPKTEMQLLELLRDRGVETCEERGRVRVIPPRQESTVAAVKVGGVQATRRGEDDSASQREQQRLRDEAAKREAERTAAEVRAAEERARDADVAKVASSRVSKGGASGSHNGIRFDMKVPDLEKMGFMCRESSEQDSRGQMRCAHMEMTGRAFSRNLERYKVEFDKRGDISMITADFVETPRSVMEVVRIGSDIKEFYPIEHEFDAEFKKRFPLVFRYMNSDGAGIQFGYLQYTRRTAINFYPSGTFKP